MLSLRPLKQRSILPGFKLSLGYTIFYLSIIVLIPLSATFLKTAQMTWPQFTKAVASPRVVASLKLSFQTAGVAAAINVVFGLLVAWVLVRYKFPGKKLVDGLVDLPFALPTAVAGIALAGIYAPQGWMGQYRPGTWLWQFGPIQSLAELLRPIINGLFWLLNRGFEYGISGVFRAFGITYKIPKYLDLTSFDLVAWLDLNYAYSRGGIIIALIFIGLPFVVRTVQPVLEDVAKEVEEAAASLGATPLQTFRKVIFPEIWPALVTGFTLAFARAVGEYGSVVFISGNRPMKTEIAPLMIITKLEQYDYRGATAIAVVMLVISFILLLLINFLQRWTARASAVK